MTASPQVALDVTLPRRLRARRWQFDGERAAYAHTSHGGLELAWIEEGGIRYRIGRKTFDLGAGQVMLVPRGVEHASEFCGTMRGGSVHLDDGFVAELSSLEPGLLEGGRDVGVLGAMLLRELSGADLLCAGAIADALVLKTARLAALPTGRRDVRVQRAIEIIRARFAEDLDVDEIATACGTTRFELSRRMKSATGKSPYQFLIDVRLEEAARLLRAQRSVTEAALSSGFNDLSRFAKAFKNKFGVLPKVYQGSAASRSCSSMRPSSFTS